MLKVLTGINYDEFRLAGILHECFCRQIGKQQDRQNTTLYLDGTIKNNTVNGDIGAVIDTEGLTYANLPEPHLERLIDVVEGDGWNDAVTELG